MIPRTLQLKNFLSYGPDMQTIDFSEYPLICLSGKNGHGKSALLDAITWAIWGQARKVSDVSKADEGLLRLGQTQMLVILDFEFNGNLYRVRREFAKTYGKPVANLDFGMVDAESQNLIPLTEKTIRATQAKIESMLNLDADAFINSAFLRQGQSNEFSKKSSKDRKEILASILGINRYEVIRKAALEKLRTAQAEQQALTAIQATIDQELVHTATICEQLTAIGAQLTRIAQQEQELERTKTACAQERSILNQKQQHLSMLSFKHEQLMQEQQTAITTLLTLRHDWRETHTKLRSLTNHGQLQAEKKSLVDEISQHQHNLQKGLELKEAVLNSREKSSALEKKILDAHASLLNSHTTQLDRTSFEKASLEKKIAELALERTRHTAEKNHLLQERTALARSTEHSDRLKEEVALLEKQFEKRKEYYQKFIVQGNWLKNELTSIEQKKHLVHDDDNPSCPLCEQNLSASRKKFLKITFAKQEQEITHKLRRLTLVIKQLKELLVEQHGALTEKRKVLETIAKQLVQQEELNKTVAKLDVTFESMSKQQQELHNQMLQLHATITDQKQALTKLTTESAQALANNHEFQQVAKLVQSLELEFKNNQYNNPAHVRAQQQLLALEACLKEYSMMPDMMAAQNQREQHIRSLCSQLKKINADAATLTTEISSCATIADQEKNIVQKEALMHAASSAMRDEKEAILQEKGKLENRQEHLQKLAIEHKKNIDFIAALRINIDDYQAIAVATGKDGIQALLIEDALPEIEQEANHLLAKLTNNQAHILIESVRDLKKGGTKETLDIKISDPMGIRPYEMFSGGEAFRIDFALRVAISKLLARRAGTSLQTLIIDEGFGSQDEEGLGHIMDALYKIQDDFSKIIIVSHLPAMKDQFPVHFVVEKGPNGSNVKVIEQG